MSLASSIHLPPVSHNETGRVGFKHGPHGPDARAELSSRIVAFLRKRHPQKWAERAAAEIGVSVGAIQKLEKRGSTPCLAIFGLMGAAYGPEFIAAVFPEWEWADVGARQMRAAQVAIEMSAMKKRLSELQASIS